MKTHPLVKIILFSCALLSASVLIFIVYFIVKESAPLIDLDAVSRFFDSAGWYPLDGEFNLVPMLVGSLYTAMGAVLLSTPIGLCVAIFGQYYAPKKIYTLYRYCIELLAGIPSVVYGLWGLTCLVPMISIWAPPGASVLAGIIILSMIILPLFIIMADAALLSVPEKYIRSAEALGICRFSIILKIVLPIALPGIFSGIILQTGRALGETMAVLMVMGNIVQIPTSVFEPARALTSNIALEMAYAVGEHRTALFVSGLLLLAVTIVIVVCAHQLKYRRYA